MTVVFCVFLAGTARILNAPPESIYHHASTGLSINKNRFSVLAIFTLPK